jgi:hypothetical protein
LNYNDGALIESRKFDQIAEELCERFGGVTEDTVRITGTWKYGCTRYKDSLFRIRVDSTDPSGHHILQKSKRDLENSFSPAGHLDHGTPNRRYLSFTAL